MVTRGLITGSSSRPRQRVALAVGFVLVFALVSCGASNQTRSASAAGYAKRTVSAGAVSVGLQIRTLDSSGATIEVSFDTHSVALDLDVARQAQLTVGGRPWPVATWSGDGPGGHHRQGALRFIGAGPLSGSLVLTLTGLPRPVSASWPIHP